MEIEVQMLNSPVRLERSIKLTHIYVYIYNISVLTQFSICLFCQIGVVHHTGHFVYVIAVHSKSACSPNFEGFPWGMQVFQESGCIFILLNFLIAICVMVLWNFFLDTVMYHNHPVRFAVFSLGLGSTASMGWSTDCLEIAPLVSQTFNRLLVGRYFP